MSIYYTVYRTTNLINHKEYIGVHKTKNPNDSYLGSGYIMKRAIKQYGKENFKKEVLFVFDTEEAMLSKEAEIVNEEYVKREYTYNLVSGGKYRDYYSKETRDKLSKGTTKYFLDNPSARENISKKISEYFSNLNNRNKKSQDMRNYYIENRMIGRPHTDETKDIISRMAKERYSNKESNPMFGKYHKFLECPHCLCSGRNGAFCRFHFDNCKYKDVDKSLIPKHIECPYCNSKLFNRKQANRYHFDNCNLKSTDAK